MLLQQCDQCNKLTETLIKTIIRISEGCSTPRNLCLECANAHTKDDNQSNLLRG